mgnify:CR=1 FL=1
MARFILATLLLLLSTAASAVVDVYTTYYHTDLNASPNLATNETGAVIWRESFLPYGKRRIDSAPSNENNQWYTGNREDATGMVYMGARLYDPQIGRFLSVDPVHFIESSPASFNRYAYANNSPYGYVDPNGELPILLVIPLVVKAIDYGVTAYDTYQAYQEGGVAGAAEEVAISSAQSIIPGLKTGKRLFEAADRLQDTTKSIQLPAADLGSTPDFIVSSKGVALPTNKDFNLVDSKSADSGGFLQIHSTHTDGKAPGISHTHHPEHHQKSRTRETTTTSGAWIDEADRRLRSGEMRERRNRRDKGGT